MKIIIIDNSNRWLRLITNTTKDTLSEMLEIEILPFRGYNNKLREVIFDGIPKIYLIDFELDKEMNGNDIAHEIRQDAFDWKSIIIIFSGYDRKEDIITKRLSIYTYISKDEYFIANLEISVKSAINILNSYKYIEVKENRQVYQIPINEIIEIYKEKLTKYCIIKTLNNNQFRVRSSLTEINKDINFKRINSYTLINPIYINKIKIINNR